MTRCVHGSRGSWDREMPGIEAFVLDDTGFPKKGTFSVGVQRQYSGTLGRRDNCQVATSLHLAGEMGSGCVALRLYLPESWATDRAARGRAGVPMGRSNSSENGRSRLIRSTTHFVGVFVDMLCSAMLATVTAVNSETLSVSEVFPTSSESTVLISYGHQEAIRTVPHESLAKVAKHRRDMSTITPSRFPIADLVKDIPRNKYKRVSWREGSRGRQTSCFLAFRIPHRSGSSPRQASVGGTVARR